MSEELSSRGELRAALADERAEVERWKQKYRDEFNRSMTLEQRLAESVPVHTGWRGYSDGSRSPVERWVRASNGDWVSLDSTRRTSGDIVVQHFSSVPDWKARAEAAEAVLANVPNGDAATWEEA